MLASTIPGLQYLAVTPDNRVFYGEEDPHYENLKKFEAVFGSNTRVAFVVSCKEAIEDCDELRESSLWLADISGGLPFATRTDSIVSFPELVSDAGQVSSHSTLEYVCPEKSGCRSDLLGIFKKPQLSGRYINPSRTAVATLVSLDLEIGSVDAVSIAFEAAQKLLHSHEEMWPSLDIRYVGTVPLMQAFVEAAEKDSTSIFAVAILVIVLLLYFCLRSFQLVLILLAIGLVTVGITLGIAGWTGLVLNTATATIPLVLFTLTIATSMHFFMHLLRSSYGNPDWSSSQAAQAALSAQWIPVLLTTSSTSVCMLSLLTVDSPPVMQIGLWTAVGMVVGTSVLLLVVPVFCASIRRPKPSAWQSFIQRRLNAYARLIEQDTIPVGLILGALIASSVLIVSLEVDDDFVRYFDEKNDFRVDTEYVAKELFGPSNLEIQIDAGEPDGVFDPTYLAFINSLSEFLRDQLTVRNVVSYSDVIVETNKHFGEGLALDELSVDAVAQMFMAYEFSLEQGQSTSDLVDMERRYSRVSVALADVTSMQVIDLESSIYGWVAKSPLQYGVVVTGESIPISHLSSRNILAMLISISVTFLATAIFLAFVFQNARVGLIALISTVVPVVLGFGIWSIGADTIGLSTTVIISVCIGVVIDDSIHLIHRHFDAFHRLELGKKQAAAYAVHRVGVALITTTVVIVSGFMVLMFSDFKLNSSFAACSSLILTSALLFDLLISPKLLVWASPEMAHTKKYNYKK